MGTTKNDLNLKPTEIYLQKIRDLFKKNRQPLMTLFAKFWNSVRKNLNN